jgi:hypothetical protein
MKWHTTIAHFGLGKTAQIRETGRIMTPANQTHILQGPLICLSSITRRSFARTWCSVLSHPLVPDISTSQNTWSGRHVRWCTNLRKPRNMRFPSRPWPLRDHFGCHKRWGMFKLISIPFEAVQYSNHAGTSPAWSLYASYILSSTSAQ